MLCSFNLRLVENVNRIIYVMNTMIKIMFNFCNCSPSGGYCHTVVKLAAYHLRDKEKTLKRAFELEVASRNLLLESEANLPRSNFNRPFAAQHKMSLSHFIHLPVDWGVM